MPDVAVIFGDRAVAGEIAAAGDVGEARFGPSLLVLIEFVGGFASAVIRVEVGEDGSFTLENAGFYTLYLTTQSRQTYRTLLYVEK